MTPDEKLDILLERLEKLEQGQQEILLNQKFLYRQIEALFALYHQIKFRRPLLDMRGWSISPDLAALYAQLITKHSPKVILELGSGQSTIISAYCLEKAGQGHVFAVDHDEKFAEITQENIREHNLEKYATVIHAPLVIHKIDDKEWQWYDLTLFNHITDVELLLVDGPPQYANPNDMARFPAIPLLINQLASSAIILLDDADRNHERQISEVWLRDFPLQLMRYYESSYGDTEKGTKVFRIR